MKKIIIVLVFLLGFPITLAGIADAGCVNKYVCDSNGMCTWKPVCTNAWDVPVPSVRAPRIIAPTVPRIQPPVVPPVGTSRCRQVRVIDSFGIPRWQTLCR